MAQVESNTLLASRAQHRIFYAIRRGKISRPNICEQCGKQGYTRAHHDDYLQPLKVRWLCGRCHSLLICSNHKPKRTGICNDGRGNRPKTERNQKILALWNNGRGWRQKSIARMFKMTEGAVQMTIARAKATPAKAVSEIQEGAV